MKESRNRRIRRHTGFFGFLGSLVLLVSSCASAPDARSSDGEAFTIDLSTPEKIYLLARELPAVGSPSERKALAGQIYRTAKQRGWIPLILHSSVVFLYESLVAKPPVVEIRGDLNGWNMQRGSFPVPLVRVADTGLFMSEPVSLDRAARFDYKIVRNASEWIDDPGNPRKIRGGFGSNSWCAMPAYCGSPWVDALDGSPSSGTAGSADVPSLNETARGTIVPDRLLSSGSLGYDVSYSVYLPARFDRSRKYPLLFVTDGQEYVDPNLGAVPQTVDRLTAAGAIEPLIVVFVDPRDPERRNINRRQEQYACNPRFASFLADELYRKIASDYPVIGSPGTTAILGTSFGGINSAFLGLTKPDVFGLIAIQSPAIRFLEFDNTAILDLYRRSPRVNLFRIWIDSGSLYDTSAEAREFRDLLVAKGYSGIAYREFPEGHSWGSWRVRIPDILLYFFGKK
jgi:enterochelin esterase family protein